MNERGPASDEERLNWLILSRSENVGPTTFKNLIKRFRTAGDALRALPELTRKGGLSRAPRIWSRDAAERAMAAAEKIGARFLCSVEPAYPASLGAADTAPPLLCIKGDDTLLARSGVAIVGARNASALARKFSRQLAREIGGEGHVIVSGLARGIDTAAMTARSTPARSRCGRRARRHLPAGACRPPRADRRAGPDRLGAGAGHRPKADFFPRRNRIISGLSRAAVVVEAALRSGSLITARFAAEQGREVFAVPGSPLDPRAKAPTA